MANVQSPKNSIGTRNSVTSPNEVKRSIVISQVSKEKSESGSEYGQNYFEYVNGDSYHQVGTVDVEGRREFGSYHSGG